MADQRRHQFRARAAPGQSGAVGSGGWQLRYDYDLAHDVNGESRDGRANGHIIVDGDSGTLGVGLRNFWQRYPKALVGG